MSRMGVPYTTSPKRVIPKKIITFDLPDLWLAIERHKLQIWKKEHR